MVLYVEDSTMKARLFKEAKKAIKFVETFTKKHPDPMEGYWVDMLVTDITGDITSLDYIKVYET